MDFESGELRKRGIKVPIQTQPMQVLRLLVERPGQVVTRKELRERLWPADTFVDFELGLNSAVKKVRRALDDSSDTPRFVETLARVGYRFIAPVQDLVIEPAEESERAAAPGRATKAIKTPPRRTRSIPLWTCAAGALLLAALYWFFPVPNPRVGRLTQITHTVAVDPWGELVTDGSRLYFLERDRDHWNVVQTSTSGGEVERFSAPFHNTRILDISPDLSEFLIASFEKREAEMPLWTLPVQGGAPRRVGNVVATDARFMTDGRRILYVRGRELFVVNDDGTNSRTFLRTDGVPYSLAWSPDGRILRYTLENRPALALQEVSIGGGRPHRILDDPVNTLGDFSGRFSPDGKTFFFSSWRGGQMRIWAVREGSNFPRRVRRQPVPLTVMPGDFWDPFPSRDGKRVFFFGRPPSVDELARYEISARRFAPYMPETHVVDAAYSRDGQWVAYAGSDQTLARRRADGSEQQQLTFPPLTAMRFSWSPDDSLIAFEGVNPGTTPKVYVVPSNGGSPRFALDGEGSQTYPCWSPDGKWLALSVSSAGSKPSPAGILLIDWKTRKPSRLPGSEDLTDPKFSPDGQRIAALSGDQRSIKLYDARTSTWRSLATGVLLTGVRWSPDGASVYFQDLLEGGQPVYRLKIADGTRERIADFRETVVTGVYRYGFAGLTPEGDLLIVLNRSQTNIYALDLE